MCRRLAGRGAHLLSALYAFVSSRGEYPVERLFAFNEYSKRVAPWRVLWVLLRSCMPPMALLIVFDLMPLRDPSEGWKASGWFWVRTAANGFLCSAGILMQMNHFVLDKPLSLVQMLAIMTSVSIGYTSSIMALASQWAFPIPFTMTLSGLPLVVFFNGSLLLAIGTRDRQVLTKILRFTNIVGVQTSMVLVYPGFHAAFLTLNSTSQVAFMALLPVIKITYKLTIAKISSELDDLRPAIIASVDLFDALYMTKCMQSAGAIWVGVGVIALDVVQNYVALSILFRQFRALHGAHGHIVQLPGASKDLLVQISSLLASKEMLRTSSLRLESRTLLPVSQGARAELERLKEMRLDELESSARSAKSLLKTTTSEGPSVKDIVAPPPSVRGFGLSSVVPFADRNEPKASSSKRHATAEANTLLLRETMRLLYESESIVLVEYIESIVPVFYAMYLVILFHLPNAKYYQDVSQLTAEKLQKIVTNILIYAFVEFLSLVYVNEALKRNFGVSAFHQLAFTLEHEWRIFQSNFNSWIVFIFQFLLLHNGADFSFQFAWLHQVNASSGSQAPATT